MIYEARESPRRHYILAGLCAALSLLGFFVAGIIPSASTRDHGASPLVGWLIIAACFGIAFIFLRRARSGAVKARLDPHGVYAPQFSDRTIPWDQVVSVRCWQHGVQQVVNFELRDPEAFRNQNALLRAAGAVNSATGFGHFGINPTFYDRGMSDLLVAVRHYRPDLL